MDDVDGEVGQKMRSAIKAKLTELGCYVDDELPDYVMVMVANKRTRSQMEDDLQLFLGDNTELFVNWLHQVLKKLQEVSATPVTKSVETEKKPERSLKEKKSKDKKDKSKKSDSSKKSKKKAKEKAHKKKDDKKKSKKKSKHEMIRPNIPPLLMNIEKESEPSITDVFAGQILKNHGVLLDALRGEAKVVDQKPILTEAEQPAVPIIDPETIVPQTISIAKDTTTSQTNVTVSIEDKADEIPTIESIIKETDEIEAVIEESKQKLAEQNDKADSTDDEDFLNIRTEADELINDFGDDVAFKEITQPLIETPPLRLSKVRSPSPVQPAGDKKTEIPEALPQIELNLPKRPVRERLGALKFTKDAVEEKEKENRRKTLQKANSPERNTPELEADARVQIKSAKSRVGSLYERLETHRKRSTSDDSEISESSSKRLTSRVSVLENRLPRVTCASVVRVRPRPRVGAPASNLLLRAVADAHKSLLNIPPKVEVEPQKVKRALVLPMRRNVDPKKIVIQVPCTEVNTATDSISDSVSLGELDSEDDDKNSKTTSDVAKDEYRPFSKTKVIKNNEYVPTRTLIRRDDSLLVETINIHNTTVDKDKGTQFIVTMDGYHPNAFLAKKLMNEGLLNDNEEIDSKAKESPKPEENNTGVFRHTEETKDTEISESAREATVSPITSAKEPSDEISQSPLENIKDIRSILEKRKCDGSIDKPVLEKRKRDVSVERPILKKQIIDSAVETPLLNEQKSDSSIERHTSETRKTDVLEQQINEYQAGNIPTVEAVTEKSIINDISIVKQSLEKRKSDTSLESMSSKCEEKSSPLVKKRKASPIVFDVNKKGKEEEKVRERTVSASSDSHVILTTASNTHKYDSLPPLSQATRALTAPGPVVWCRTFPQCRYGAACAFAHPRCKFAAACTRRGCPYEHVHATAATPLATAPAITGSPIVASHVVPAANYKSISSATFANLCKYYPNCTNPTCHYYHPKPCRYGKACSNKLECNFYHIDVPGGKWKYSI